MTAILFPGQGAQFKGMGKDLFPRYPQLTIAASEILGYSIEELCLEDPQHQLRLTQYTQPALYVVNALGYLKWREEESTSSFKVNFLAGHSLGEYNALLAAEVFDFETGLRLVQKRGELMGAAKGGSMAAVIGVNAEVLRQLFDTHALSDIDLANFNTPTQTVIAGKTEDILEAERVCAKNNIRCVILNVSAPFHSRYMKDAEKVFTEYLSTFTLHKPKVPVVSNVTARPYETGKVAPTLGAQISSSVSWNDTIRYLMGQGVTDYIEIGSKILTKMVNEIVQTETPIIDQAGSSPKVATIDSSVLSDAQAESAEAPKPAEVNENKEASGLDATKQIARQADVSGPALIKITAESLGSKSFRERYKLKYAYLAGAMYRGVASPKIVIRMGRAGFLGFLGTGGLPLKDIEKGIHAIQGELKHGEPYGVNFLASYNHPEREADTVNLLLKYKIQVVEAAAFMEMSSALVRYRVSGLRKDDKAKVVCDNKIIAKVSRPEVAEKFLSPPPPQILTQLIKEGHITEEQAELAQHVPMSYDICVEADSGGHTDGGIPTVLFPAMLQLKKRMSQKYDYPELICMGLAGGIGTPEAAASAFMMGADFILTGSINQCTVDAGISDPVKQMLAEINVQDTEYAPAGDMFEMGSKVQVLKKGVFFPTRANKLFSLYSHYNSLDEIPEKIKKQIEGTYFKKSFADVWNETKTYLSRQNQSHEVAKAEANPKHKMALVFRWYFGYSTRITFEGNMQDSVNFQVHTGPALGAFNQWVKGTQLESWRNRHADEIGILLLKETAEYLTTGMSRLAGNALN